MDYTSQINLICPHCQNSEFDDTGSVFTCTNCNTKFNQDELEKANESRIQEQIVSFYDKEIIPDIAQKLNSGLKEKFKNNPNVIVK